MDKRKFLSHFLSPVQKLQRDTIGTGIIFWVHTRKDNSISIFVSISKDEVTFQSFNFYTFYDEERNKRTLDDLKDYLNS